MATQRLLIFAYDFPPSLVGVRRTVKMIRYLQEFGWACAVVTVRPVCASGWDDAPLREVAAARPTVYRTGSLDPYRLCMKWREVAWPLMRRVYHGPSGGSTGTELPRATGGWKAGIMRWMRRAVLIPDDRVGWLPFAAATGLSVALRGKPDALYSTSYPHTAHLAAGLVHSLTGIPWVADFRDGWTQNPAFYDPPTPLHAAIHRGLERWVARRADRVVTVSPPITDHLQRWRKAHQADVETIYNGFDEAASGQAEWPPRGEKGDGRDGWQGTGKFHLLYGGTFFGSRTPETLFRGLALAAARRPDLRDRLRLVLHTALDPQWHALLRDLELEDRVEIHGFVPFQEILERQRQAGALVLVVDTGPGSEIIVTQKVFEYLASGSPIWALAGPGACRDLLERTGGAVLSDPHDPEDAARGLETLFDAWREGRNLAADPEKIAPFHRREQARRLAQILEEMTGNTKGRN